MKGQLQKMQAIKRFLATNIDIRNFVNYLGRVMSRYNPEKQKQFIESDAIKKVSQKMVELNLGQLQDMMDMLIQPETIIALPIAIDKYFTLFFVIVPAGSKFQWHDHSQMLGKTKCLHGSLTITSIERELLKKEGKFLTYPGNDIKVERLTPNQENSVSTILPQSYNIHKIEAKELSAFFDLLMPDYPSDDCLFLETMSQSKDKMILRRINDSCEVIKGFDQVLRELTQKNKVKNIILK